MRAPIQFEIPLPPTLNSRVSDLMSGRHKTARSRAQHETFKEAVLFNQSLVGVKPLDGWLLLELDLHLKRDRDIDSSTKVLMDVLNGKLWHDDSQVVKLIVEKYRSAVPKAVVRVRHYTQRPLDGARMQG